MNDTTLSTTYDPRAIEQDLYNAWEQSGAFAPTGQGEPYCIMLPPPNVTGILHMGHAFQCTIVDILIRYHRMSGDNTLWQTGMDHAGIATQMVVERELAQAGQTRHDLGRERFVKKVWEWKHTSGGAIRDQFRRMGASLDWQNERFTMDEQLSIAVREVFVRLHDEGLIYRGKRLVNWDPKLHTALSDLEVLSVEEQSFLWHIRYPVSNSTEHLVVATTRPETMLGDCAVAVNPDDARYQHLLGKTVDLPLCNRTIPIIADDHADPAFGSGCVKITPAHDTNDYAVWQSHKAEASIASQPHGGLINIFTQNAAIRANDADEAELIPSVYASLDRFVARKRIVADLEAQGFIEKIVPHKLMVPRGDRSGEIVEPFLTNQWYVKVAPLAKPAIEAVQSGAIKFVPDNWKNTYFEWMNNIQDWCISRQIWWGHRIPAWYDDDDNIFVGRSETEVRAKYKLEPTTKLRQDDDVLDTWFSSGLWPFSTLGWPQAYNNATRDGQNRLQMFYPTSVLVTGFDIIFFWVARMIMLGLKFMDEPPFREVYMHGLIRDAHGHKMSKSKGNVLDPIDLIDGISLEDLIKKRVSGLMQPELQKGPITNATKKEFPDGIVGYGTDALRFTFAALASTGRDINFDLGRVQGYRNFCNKLWNAARYVLMRTEGEQCGFKGEEFQLSSADKWIISRLQETIATTHESIGAYRFDILANSLYDFCWNEYCDWYLELSKPILNNEAESAAAKRGTRHTLLYVLEMLLRLLHPIMPYITEALWLKIAPLMGLSGDTIMLSRYPIADKALQNQSANRQIEWTKQFILSIRKIKAEMNLKPAQQVPVLLVGASTNDQQLLQQSRVYIDFLAKPQSIEILDNSAELPKAAVGLMGQMQIMVPLAGLIDKSAELARLNKEITKLDKLQASLEKKLSNQAFIKQAPAKVVEAQQSKLAATVDALAKLNANLQKISAL